jgi:hypothetical protein
MTTREDRDYSGIQFSDAILAKMRPPTPKDPEPDEVPDPEEVELGEAAEINGVNYQVKQLSEELYDLFQARPQSIEEHQDLIGIADGILEDIDAELRGLKLKPGADENHTAHTNWLLVVEGWESDRRKVEKVIRSSQREIKDIRLGERVDQTFFSGPMILLLFVIAIVSAVVVFGGDSDAEPSPETPVLGSSVEMPGPITTPDAVNAAPVQDVLPAIEAIDSVVTMPFQITFEGRFDYANRIDTFNLQATGQLNLAVGAEYTEVQSLDTGFALEVTEAIGRPDALSVSGLTVTRQAASIGSAERLPEFVDETTGSLLAPGIDLIMAGIYSSQECLVQRLEQEMAYQLTEDYIGSFGVTPQQVTVVFDEWFVPLNRTESIAQAIGQTNNFGNYTVEVTEIGC